jgi:hypothetical protein
MHKTVAYLYFGYKPLRCQLYFSCLITCGDFLMVDVVIPTLTTYIHVLATVLGMPLNLLKDVVIRLHGIGSPGLLLLLASFGLLLSLASLGISIPSATLGPRQHHWSFPPSRGVRWNTLLCARGGYRLLWCFLYRLRDSPLLRCCVFHAQCLRRHLFGCPLLGDCLHHCRSTGSALGAACSLVALVAADDGPPPVASCSGISVDAKL